MELVADCQCIGISSYPCIHHLIEPMTSSLWTAPSGGKKGHKNGVHLRRTRSRQRRTVAKNTELRLQADRTGVKARLKTISVELTAYKNDAALAFLISVPRALQFTLTQHVHRLKYQPPGLAV
jgi:hypothetical protein